MQWAFAICLLFTIGNVNTDTNTPTGLPMIEVYYQATNSVAATNVFIVAIAFVICVALFNVLASVSRLTWAFARDHGLPFSRFFSQVSAKHVKFYNVLIHFLRYTPSTKYRSTLYVSSLRSAFGRWGIPINLASLAYIFYTATWIPFPTILPVTAQNMNYSGPILLAIIFAALIDWSITGHKRFELPVAREVSEF